MRRLPPGPHGLSAELVARNQRERLISAMAEVCGERGYADSSVAEVAKRAGVSTASFYRQFKDRKECLLVSFEELFGRLLAEIERACAGAEAPAEGRKAALATAAALLAADRPTARLLAVEIGAAGPDGVRALHCAIDRLAELLREPGTKAPSVARDAAWAAVAAMVSLAGLRVSEGKSPTAADLEEVAALS
jgi:AcrR family transcriptional regulator